jgi:hypothetical protein
VDYLPYHDWSTKNKRELMDGISEENDVVGSSVVCASQKQAYAVLARILISCFLFLVAGHLAPAAERSNLLEMYPIQSYPCYLYKRVAVLYARPHSSPKSLIQTLSLSLVIQQPRDGSIRLVRRQHWESVGHLLLPSQLIFTIDLSNGLKVLALLKKRRSQNDIVGLGGLHVIWVCCAVGTVVAVNCIT